MITLCKLHYFSYKIKFSLRNFFKGVAFINCAKECYYCNGIDCSNLVIDRCGSERSNCQVGYIILFEFDGQKYFSLI